MINMIMTGFVRTEIATHPADVLSKKTRGSRKARTHTKTAAGTVLEVEDGLRCITYRAGAGISRSKP